MPSEEPPPHTTLHDGESCLIITGAPAAGKSTVSRLVAGRLGRSALLDGDLMDELIVNGRVWALGQPADEAARQVALSRRNLCALAANFADAGFTPVLDTLVPHRAHLDALLEALHPRRVLLVVLAPAIEVCRHRNTIRPELEQFFFDDYQALTTTMRTSFGSLGWWLDTSALTAEETATQVLAEAATLAARGL